MSESINQIVDVQNVSKVYKVYEKPSDHIVEILSCGRRTLHHRVVALNSVTFSVKQGERIGILGENGSGKSTLLKIISGVLRPSSGDVSIRGRVSSLLELGTGFNSELSGKENVLQNGMLMGYSRAEMEERYPLIREFSELDVFIDKPIKTYSSGMLVRLAFSCAVFVDPDILIIDEALSVGDAYFQTKCFYKIKSLLEKGATFLYVTHSADSVRSLCNRCLLMDKGSLMLDGNAEHVSNEYFKKIIAKQNKSKWYDDVAQHTEQKLTQKTEAEVNVEGFQSDVFEKQVSPLRTGTGEARILNAILFDHTMTPAHRISFGKTATIRVLIQIFENLSEKFSIGVGIADSKGIEILQFSSLEEGFDAQKFHQKEKTLKVDFSFTNVLAPGDYDVKLGLANLTQSPFQEAYMVICWL
jgi:lipopolysaccharide transport system ATP-binding protein